MSTTNLLITDRDKIRKHWGKTETEVFKDVEIIREWLLTQPHLPETPNDRMIEFFLTNCKYSIEKTKQNLDMYYTVRDLLPDIYRSINPNSSPDMDLVYNAGDYVLLPELTTEFYRITLIKYRATDSDKSDIRKANSHFLANLYEVRIQEDLSMGDIYIVDFENYKLGHMTKVTPVHLKQYAFIMEKVQSNRMKQLHLVNPPGFVGNMMAIFRSLLSKKLQERIFVHKSIEELLKHIPLELLPSDYGGGQKSIEEFRELWKLKMQEYKDRLDYLQNIKVKEELRPEKLQNHELLGYHGNFKKIDVD